MYVYCTCIYYGLLKIILTHNVSTIELLASIDILLEIGATEKSPEVEVSHIANNVKPTFDNNSSNIHILQHMTEESLVV